MNGLNVKVRDLVKVHHTGKIEVQALRGLSLDIASGELVSIIRCIAEVENQPC